MPKTLVTSQEEEGRFGASYVKSVVENGWRAFLQPYDGMNDRGLDGMVLDTHRGSMTSYQFNVQIKTSSFDQRQAGDSFRVPLDKKHIELWRDSNVPVVLVCVNYDSPPIAYWRVIMPTEKLETIRVYRRNVFGPESRDDVIAAIRHALPQDTAPIRGEILTIPLHVGVRDVAKDYYYKNLLRKAQPHPVFGPIEFTWKGWKHLTRRGRPTYQTANSLLLLPCVRSVLRPGTFPSKWRSPNPVIRGNRVQHRTILVFERTVKFRHRGPACVKVVIERQASIPRDWATSTPEDPRRMIKYTFLSIYEHVNSVKASTSGL